MKTIEIESELITLENNLKELQRIHTCTLIASHFANEKNWMGAQNKRENVTHRAFYFTCLERSSLDRNLMNHNQITVSCLLNIFMGFDLPPSA